MFGHDEIEAIHEAIEAMPDGDYFDDLVKRLMSAVTLIRTHVLDENDAEAINQMRFVSLFAGVGGFDLGLERAGMQCVGQVEIDKHARSVLEKHWPNVPKHDDVVTAKEWADEQGLVGSVDVV